MALWKSGIGDSQETGKVFMAMKKIFISYSHKDEHWKDLLVRHLKVLPLEGLCDPWDDRRIETGEEWKPAS